VSFSHCPSDFNAGTPTCASHVYNWSQSPAAGIPWPKTLCRPWQCALRGVRGLRTTPFPRSPCTRSRALETTGAAPDQTGPGHKMKTEKQKKKIASKRKDEGERLVENSLRLRVLFNLAPLKKNEKHRKTNFFQRTSCGGPPWPVSCKPTNISMRRLLLPPPAKLSHPLRCRLQVFMPFRLAPQEGPMGIHCGSSLIEGNCPW